ncbi:MULTISPECIES: lytic polysaccharide monooxygenase [Micromonospora]|uniref:Chitin-binding protein n=1 Tax=Micromonospora yangpuensis TaxID=683228 RepID=A0A1C6UM85_9ACTN|nr:lytic polysaccharide monooxygenase [Micromonospora yangpuensis]GGM27714.1 hypothetical protein GCM10012279_52870 [Micromonospora yangpuensis]SCL55155.1 chitin-binding protein [Micromonospora yangpuensis]
MRLRLGGRVTGPGPTGNASEASARPLVRRGVAVATAVLLAGGSVLAGVVAMGDEPAAAHGSMQSPASRIYLCYQEGPETPRSPACQALREAGGSQPVYDWNGVLVSDVAGRHRQVIPDGKLCSAGNEAFRGLDLPRADWPATSLPSGGDHRFLWHGTAPHVGTFEFYVTRDGYQPDKPLTWADLESEPFLRADRPQLRDGVFRIDGKLPAKRGRHLIYTIYQRTDSPEAFYACSDVTFGGGDAPAPPQQPEVQPPGGVFLERESPAPEQPAHTEHEHAPEQHDEHDEHDERPGQPGGGEPERAPHTPETPPSGEVAGWAAGTAYPAGAQVTYQERTYVAVQAHTAQPGWDPPLVPALWHAVAPTEAAGGVAAWQPQTPYETGSHVTFEGVVYMCRQGHIALPGWEPTRTPALWEPMG